ncbi:MAG: class I mannose-6-phosphate isomerase [Candidatus Limnocylindria bacterium]
MPYDASPRYPLSAGAVESGYAPLADEIARLRPARLAIDGPAALDWDVFVDRLQAALRERGLASSALDVRDRMLPWSEIVRRTERPILSADPVFAAPESVAFEDLIADRDVGPPAAHRSPPRGTADGGVTVVYGPGSAAFGHDLLWYADLPKRLALEACEAGRARNLGQPHGAVGTSRRLLFVDWPIEDTHRRAQTGRWQRYVDASDGERPRSVGGDVLRHSLRALTSRPFRTLPAFLAEPWGGRWARDVLGVREGGPHAAAPGPNAGLGYELVAPESGILLGERDTCEVALDVLVGSEPRALLGRHVVERFGASLPIRLDYLDTVDGGDLSVHCHPMDGYMREVFGLPYTQDETYYVMTTRPGARIFLGLREGADVAAFRDDAERSHNEARELDVDRFIAIHPAVAHQIYLVPAGTPHGSGEGNVVLEISATPYLYSLRFYDWLRAGLDGRPRPVQLEHAFANLDRERLASSLVPTPRLLRRASGVEEWIVGEHPDLFFTVRRLHLGAGAAAEDTTRDRFHVLNVVKGEGVVVHTAAAEHRLAYAETLLVPAGAGGYRVEARDPAMVVKAFVA